MTKKENMTNAKTTAEIDELIAETSKIKTKSGTSYLIIGLFAAFIIIVLLALFF